VIKRPNKVKQKLARNEHPIGAFVQMNNPEVVEVIGNAGYDYVWLDSEHGSFRYDGAIQMIRAAEATGMTPLLRVPNHEPTNIMHALDAGAMGVIVPQVTTAAQARSVVAAAKYQISGQAYGNRGACPLIRTAGHQTPDWKEFAQWSNDNVTVWLLVETVEGIDNLDEILDVPGVDAIVLGAFDLSISMGYDGDRNHPAVIAKLDGLMDKVRARNVDVVGMLFADEATGMLDMKKTYEKQGCRIFIAGTDRRILVNTFNAIYTLVSETK
jgi:4-hydroxy-2-oxoheptanedioate aldolase